jgi:hypothetical protein
MIIKRQGAKRAVHVTRCGHGNKVVIGANTETGLVQTVRLNFDEAEAVAEELLRLVDERREASTRPAEVDFRPSPKAPHWSDPTPISLRRG